MTSPAASSFSLPHNSAEVGFAGEYDARRRGRFDEQSVAGDSKLASLLGAVPLLIPRRINARDEVTAFDPVLASVREHGLMERGSFRVTRARCAILRSCQRDRTPLACQDQVAFGMQPEDVLRR